MSPPRFFGNLTAYRYVLQIHFDILTELGNHGQFRFMAAISSIDHPKSRAAEEQADPSFATTLAHGLDVLAAFRNRSGSLSNAELALHTGLSRPPGSRPTSTLAPLGYLKRDAKGRFQLGLGSLHGRYPWLSGQVVL